MKYLIAFLTAITLVTNVYSQCSFGGDGIAVSTPITVDGNISDWNSVLSDPDNYAMDAVPDLDAPIADVGRNFTQFAFTETYSNLFLYFGRAGSATNAVDALLYVDVNNNGLMETNEPVVAISWSGSNGNGKVDMYNYVQSAAGGDVISGDGVDMPGMLLLRNSLGVIGRGTSDGLALEVGIPFNQFYKQGSTDPADMLAPKEPFKFHLSTINGSPTSVPGPNAINDNFNGCNPGFMILPVKLEYFEAKNIKAGLELMWKVSDNENVWKFEIEASNDGKNFETIGVVDASANTGSQEYSYSAAGSSKNYYRLKMIDSEGGVEYSKVLAVNATGIHTMSVKVSNPVYSDVTIMYESAQNETCNVRIFNIAGVQVYSQTMSMHAGTNKMMISGSSLKVNGTYILEMTDQLNKRSSHKLVKL